MTNLGIRCVNCRVSAYSRMGEGIQVDNGWLCADCVKLTAKPE